MSADLPFDRLMADLRGGAPDAARAVFDRFTRRLVGLAATRLPGFARATTDPEDVAQSVLRTFFRRHGEGEFRPDNPRVVHHANILIDRTAELRRQRLAASWIGSAHGQQALCLLIVESDAELAGGGAENPAAHSRG